MMMSRIAGIFFVFLYLGASFTDFRGNYVRKWVSMNAQIKSRGIEIYTTAGCKYCRKAKYELDNMRLPYKNIDISNFIVDGIDDVINERILKTRTTTVPQIYIEDELIGGCDSLLEAISTGAWQKRLDNYSITPEIKMRKDAVMNTEMSNDLQQVLSVVPLDGLNNLNIIVISSILQEKILTLSDKYISADGSRVNYSAMKKSKEFAEYIAMTGALKSISLSDIQQLSEPLRFSFFTNLYNALIIHATCLIGAPANTPADRTLFFKGISGAKYNIGGILWSPDDIEHGVLRANYPHPSQNTSTYFEPEDPRSRVALSSLDPRLHFILNCGAQSCPPIKVLTGDPEPALKAAAVAYLDNEIRVDKELRRLYLPRLALWYAKDFGSDIITRIQLLMSFLSEDRRASLKKDLDDVFPRYFENFDESCVEYNIYNWGSNDDRSS